MMNRCIAVLTERLGVFRTWGSFARVTAWVVVWAALLGIVVVPNLPSIDDRERTADEPASSVRYVGPVSRQDYAGFIAPPPLDDHFTLAWVGGSEIKFQTVSVAGEVSNRIATFGDRPVQVDGYQVIAPRPIDALRGLEAAIDNGADAIAISLNPAWVSDEWSMRDWENMDVSGLGTLWGDPASWPWAVSLTSPADIAWRVSRAAFALVEAQTNLNERAQDLVDSLDLVERPVETDAAPTPIVGDPRLPDDPSMFWMVEREGPEILADNTERVAAMIDGFDDDRPVAEFFARRLLDTAESAGVPVFVYTAPFSPESLANPHLEASAETMSQFWERMADPLTSDLVEVEYESLTPEFADRASYIDLIHMTDAGPFAEVLVPRLCAQWAVANPDQECR